MNVSTKAILLVSMLLNTTIASAAFVTNNTNGGDGFVEGAFPTFTLAGANNGIDDEIIPMRKMMLDL